ncbi:hypothetical protein OG439_00560 [Amycolatopsis sp. NBC_01307]|uniref:hypothetical protein n=1 Tax=Amycolatopsis sp. NBC_01307 TaxID=2903561 RepID=UPI002E0E3DEC|nr:hypothetical protein OG439_00560 [Amycolatopsis sp. NBC_01307]
MRLLRLMVGTARAATFAQHDHPSYRQPGDPQREPDPEDVKPEACPRRRCKGRIRKNSYGDLSCSKCGFIPPAKTS